MFKGFYNLTSGVLTNQRNLNVIADNMVNVSTSGYKQDIYTATTFDEVVYSRVGNKDSEGVEIGGQSYIRATSEIYTDFSQGALEPTGIALDFAINGEGFFAIQNEGGETAYTRGGNFSLDDDGYLVLGGVGYVLDPRGNNIYLGTDKIFADSQGIIYYEETGAAIAQIGVYAFEGNDGLERRDDGLFVGEGAQATQAAQILSGYQERSNTDLVQQMTNMMTYQRSLQSAAQLMKMYDELMTKAATQVGQL